MNRPLPASPCLRVPASSSLALSRYVLRSTFYVFALLLSASAFAQSPDPTSLIRSNDPVQQKQALTLIRAQIERDGRKIEPGLFRQWIDALRDAKLNADAAEIAGRGLPLVQDRDNWIAARLMAYKAAYSLDQGRKEDALAFLQRGPTLDSIGALAALDELRLSEPLVKAGLLQPTVDAIDQMTVTRAEDLGFLQRALSVRAQIFLTANQPQDALSSAKSFFNVSDMDNTAKALALVAKCLQAAHPEDRAMLEKFRDQQVAGATVPAFSSPALGVHPGAPGSSPTPALPPAAAAPSILAAIKVSPTVYLKSLGNDLLPSPFEEDFRKLTGTGNLLLLADRALDAKIWFEQAYRVCEDGQLPAATESIARAMKAEDATIARANAFILALRPTKPTPK